MEAKKIEILKRKSEKLKVIAHPMRLCILNCLIEKECNVTTLIEKLELPQSTVSQHLSKLKMAQIVEGHRDGVEIVYTVIDDEVHKLIEIFLESCHE